MTELFLTAVNRSLSAGWLVLAVIAVRFALKKAPKWGNVLLWGLVAFRLLCPFTLESALSLIPNPEPIPQTIMISPAPAIDSGVEIIDQVVNPAVQSSFTPDPAASANPLQIWIPIFAAVWCLGMAVMGIYALISYLRLRRMVRDAAHLRGNVYQSKRVPTPFVMGLLNPKIYLPAGMAQRDVYHVVAHERMHIRRRDHWWKPLGFFLLTVYWFHPLLWLAYSLFCRDVELACDEAAVRHMKPEQRANYSQALLNCSARSLHIAACPLAFGEIGVKERVKNVLTYRKPAFWLVLLCLVLCAIVAVCFLTDPQSDTDLQRIQELQEEDVISIWSQELTGEDLGLIGTDSSNVYTQDYGNLQDVLPWLKRIDGQRVRKPWFLDDTHCAFVTIFVRPGEHISIKLVQEYFSIGDDVYLADPQWLADYPSPYDIPEEEKPTVSSSLRITSEGARATAEFASGGGYTFFPEEAEALAELLMHIDTATFLPPEEITPITIITLTTKQGDILLLTDGQQVRIQGEDLDKLIRNDRLNVFLATYTDALYETEGQHAAGPRPLEELSRYYTMEQAGIDGVVVMYDGTLMHNQEVWNAFIANVDSKIPATVRCGKYGADRSPFLYDISFDGSQFTLNGLENGQVFEREFSSMSYYAGDMQDGMFSYTCWLLHNAQSDAEFGNPVIADMEAEHTGSYHQAAAVSAYFCKTPYSLPPSIPEDITGISVNIDTKGTQIPSSWDSIQSVRSTLAQGTEIRGGIKTVDLGASLTLHSLDDPTVITLGRNGDYFVLDGKFYSYGTGETDDRGLLWKALGYDIPPDEPARDLEELAAAFPLDGRLYSQAFLILEGTLILDSDVCDNYPAILAQRQEETLALSKRYGSYTFLYEVAGTQGNFIVKLVRGGVITELSYKSSLWHQLTGSAGSGYEAYTNEASILWDQIQPSQHILVNCK